MGLQPGDAVDVRYTKWGGGGHWEFSARYLGRDQYGHWAGAATGTRLARPGHAFASNHSWVTLFPDGLPWTAAFYDSLEPPVSIYVDVTTEPVWRSGEVSMVDLDLDVILLSDGSLVIDDEDEFKEHQVALGYPPEIVALARRSADSVLAAIGDGLEPFLSVGHEHLRSDRAGSDRL